ncbi:MAG: hypothetical protein DYG94_08800 [Leptolyngbya sp. PLA3]|nr:MAG: hypothetical protein EDM82_02995 [Cyanobacteria bacterium CYA]MCE7968829.1 hypothetical protein [Leptolyngbya sp. PL-A3]
MEEFIRQLNLTVLLPLGAALLMVLAVRRKWIEKRPSLRHVFTTALVALPLPFAFLVWLPREQAMGLLRLNLHDDWQALAYLSLVGGLIGLIPALLLPDKPWRTGLVALLLAGGTTLCIWPIVEQDGWDRRLAPGLVTALLFALLQPLGRRRPATLAACLWIACVAAGSVALFMLGQRQIAAAVSPIGASLLVLAASARWKGLHLRDGALAAALPVLVCVPAAAWLYQTALGVAYPMALILVTAAAPVAAWLTLSKLLRSKRPWISTLVAAIATAVLAGAAIGAMLLLEGAGIEEDPYTDMYGSVGG